MQKSDKNTPLLTGTVEGYLVNSSLIIDLKRLIESTKNRVISSANSELVLMYWKIGERIQEEILKNKRADYGERIVATLSQHLTEDYGKGFTKSSIARMLQFYKAFPDIKIVATLSQQLTWSHFVEVLTLKPWFENLKKRQVKSPKIYIRDSGLFRNLLNIQDNIILHPKVGAAWEGFSLEEIIRCHNADPEDCYFWATSNNAELDLLIVKGEDRMGFEFKYTDAPRMTRALHSALEDLRLDKITVIVPGNVDFLIHEKVRVRGLKQTVLETLSS